MTAWDISTAILVHTIDSEASPPEGIAWKPDGTKFYTIGSSTDERFIHESDVSTPWDISTASLNQSIGAKSFAPTDIAWKPDGTLLFEVDSRNDNIFEYTVSTPWDISTASFNQSLNTQDGTPTDIFWKSDGTMLWEIGTGSANIYEYTVSTAWDISTASFNQSINTQGDDPEGIAWKDDGTKFYEADESDGEIYESDVSTAWDISTASFNQSLSDPVFPLGLAWKPNGGKLYITDFNGYKIRQYDLIFSVETPVTTWEWDHPTASFTSGGTSALAAPVQTWEWDALAASGVGYYLDSPVQTWAWDHPTGSITVSGTATVADSGTVWEWDLPAAAVLDDEWRIDGDVILDVVDETATDRVLALTIRAETSELTATLRPLKSDEGKVNLLRTDDGGYIAVDRANGANTYYVQPPIRRSPLRRAGDVHVQTYEEQLVSQDVEEWSVELELQRNANRTDTPAIAETVASDEWGFQTRFGTIATDRVRAEFQGTGEGGVSRYEIVATLTFDEAHVFEAALSRLGGTRIRSIPDGDNEAVDDTDSTVGTLTIDVPANQDGISDGEFVVLGFESTRLSEAAQEVSVTVAET